MGLRVETGCVMGCWDMRVELRSEARRAGRLQSMSQGKVILGWGCQPGEGGRRVGSRQLRRLGGLPPASAHPDSVGRPRGPWLGVGGP